MFLAAITIDLHTPRDTAFMDALLANAAASRGEPGCRRFDVAVSDDGATVFLFEAYVDAAAFQTHRGTPHFLAYDAVARPRIRHKDVKTYTLLEP
jgi:autoinducer 2-degrading protein